MKKQFHVSGIPWPLQSPGFTVLGLFLWGNLKKIHILKSRAHTQTHTTQELEYAIQDEIATLNQEPLH
jgi:hypothetical protein